MAQLNSSIVIWFKGISQIPGNDLDGHCLLPVIAFRLKWDQIEFNFYMEICYKDSPIHL